jgi:hypothetical protein
MNGNYSTSPEEESATGRPDRDPLATQDDPAKFLTQDIHQPIRHLSGQEPNADMRIHKRSIRPKPVGSRSKPPVASRLGLLAPAWDLDL